MRRVLARVAMIGGVAALAVASTASAHRSETVTLRLLQATTLQAAQEIINKNFERVNPNVHIETTYLPSDQLVTLLLAQMQAGNAPDLFLTYIGNRANGIWPLGEAGRLLNLSGQKWNSRVYGPAKPLASWNGKVYGWPTTLFVDGIAYNVDQFKQLGLKIPTTFSDVISLCRKITAAGKVPFVQAWSTPTTGQIIGRALDVQFVYSLDPNWNAKRAKKQVTFSSSPGWRRTLQAELDMKEANCFQPGASSTSRPQQYAMFAQGQAVMSIIASSELPAIMAINPSLKVQMTAVPADNPKKTVAVAVPNIAISANAATRYPAQAREFIAFMAREQQSSLYARIGSNIAPLDIKKAVIPPALSDLKPYFKAGRYMGGLEAGWPNNLIFDQAFSTGQVGIYTGQKSVSDVLADMDRLWDQG